MEVKIAFDILIVPIVIPLQAKNINMVAPAKPIDAPNGSKQKFPLNQQAKNAINEPIDATPKENSTEQQTNARTQISK